MIGSTVSVARRRALTPVVIAAGAAGWGAFVAMTVAQHPYGLVGVVALFLFFASWVTGRVLTRDIAERRVDQVDEYEFGQRNEVRNAGYVVTLTALMVVFLTLVWGVQLAERGSPELLQQAPQYVFATFMLGAAAPTLLMLWRVRNQTDDLETEDGDV